MNSNRSFTWFQNEFTRPAKDELINLLKKFPSPQILQGNTQFVIPLLNENIQNITKMLDFLKYNMGIGNFVIDYHEVYGNKSLIIKLSDVTKYSQAWNHYCSSMVNIFKENHPQPTQIPAPIVDEFSKSNSEYIKLKAPPISLLLTAITRRNFNIAFKMLNENITLQDAIKSLNIIDATELLNRLISNSFTGYEYHTRLCLQFIRDRRVIEAVMKIFAADTPRNKRVREFLKNRLHELEFIHIDDQNQQTNLVSLPKHPIETQTETSQEHVTKESEARALLLNAFGSLENLLRRLPYNNSQNILEVILTNQDIITTIQNKFRLIQNYIGIKNFHIVKDELSGKLIYEVSDLGKYTRFWSKLHPEFNMTEPVSGKQIKKNNPHPTLGQFIQNTTDSSLASSSARKRKAENTNDIPHHKKPFTEALPSLSNQSQTNNLDSNESYDTDSEQQKPTIASSPMTLFAHADNKNENVKTNDYDAFRQELSDIFEQEEARALWPADDEEIWSNQALRFGKFS